MKELLFSITKKDFKLEFFSGTGSGGQYRNKHQNCVRLTHIESGVMATGQSGRDRPSNIREAMRGLTNSPKFKIWHTRKINEILNGKTIDQIVDEQMDAKNLKFELRNEHGKWEQCAL